MRRGAVTGGVDVRSARQQEAVDPIEQEVGRFCDRVVRRQHQRQRARALDGRGIGPLHHGHDLACHGSRRTRSTAAQIPIAQALTGEER